MTNEPVQGNWDPNDPQVLGVLDEMDRGLALSGGFHSLYEGYAFLKEEVEEFWGLVKKNADKRVENGGVERNKEIEKGLTRICAVSLRMIYELNNLTNTKQDH